jgi:uncharacterized membrane protein
MGESHALMASLMVAGAVLLAVPALVAGAAVVWYLRTRRDSIASGPPPGQG